MRHRTDALMLWAAAVRRARLDAAARRRGDQRHRDDGGMSAPVPGADVGRGGPGPVVLAPDVGGGGPSPGRRCGGGEPSLAVGVAMGGVLSLRSHQCASGCTACKTSSSPARSSSSSASSSSSSARSAGSSSRNTSAARARHATRMAHIGAVAYWEQRLGPPHPHLHQDWAYPAHICTGTVPTQPTSAPRLGSP
jgi:hypothetical protein